MGFTRVATRIISPFGYRVVKIDSDIHPEKEYYLHSYKDKIGNFDHEHYRRIQTNANRKKINNIWAREENIATISDYIKSRFSTLEFGICHGTRRGLEQKWFSKFLDCSVIGTEISDTAEEFDNTVQWDFHEVKAEWTGKADFIYSNSLDHSYDPEKALNSWISCLKPGGLCILEHSYYHTAAGASEFDPFGASLRMMLFLISLWGNGRYGVRRLLSLPKSISGHQIQAIVVERFVSPD